MDPATNMTDEWIKAALAKNPCVKLDNGNIRTCPVRLSFPHIFSPSKPVPPNTEGKHGSSLLLPLGADISVLTAEATACARAKWGDKMPKLRSPFLKQDDDAERYPGYVPGAVLIRATSNQKLPCVDQNLAPIVDEARVYPGVWAIVTLRAFAYDMGVNKGVSFGLQSVMIIADDQNIGGTGQANPSTDFAGVKIDANLNPAAAFGAEGSTAGATEPSAVDIFGS
jgi:ssDNA-binding protein